MLARLAQDVRFALRQLALRPAFAAVAVATIAFGIAAVAGMFCLVDGVLLRPLDVPHADRIVRLHRVAQAEASFSLPDAIALRGELRSFAAVSIVAPGWSLDLERDGAPPLHLAGGLVESRWFDAIQVTPIAGRLLERRDDERGAPSVAVLGERLWRSAYGADPAIVGKDVRLSGVATTIVGIAPDRADVFGSGVDLWVPTPTFAPWALTSPGSNNLELVARVRDGVPVASALRELQATSARWAASDQRTSDKALEATPVVEMLTAGVRRALFLVFGAAALVLLLAAVNVASLLLTRIGGRSREIAVRHALGARGGRIAAQLLVEGLVLGALGALVGIGLLAASLDVVRAFAAETLPRVSGVHIDFRVVAVAVGAALASALAFSIAPALNARARAMANALRGARAVGSRDESRTLGALVVAEVALAATLVIVAALLMRSFLVLSQEPLGFSPDGVALGEVVLPEARYGTVEAQSRAVAAMVERIAREPGVQSAGWLVGTPLSGGCCMGHTVVREGVAVAPVDEQGARFRAFHGDVFGALGIELARGRPPLANELAGGERVAWVNERFARKFFADADPVGQRIAWKPGEVYEESNGPQWMRIVGVVRDLRAVSMREGDDAAVYAPYLQRDADWVRFGHLVARVSGDPATFRPMFEESVAEVDPALPLASFETMPGRVRAALAGDRFALQLVGGFGAIALLLGLQGVFGVVAFTVERRRAEIALRVALGAPPARAASRVLRAGAKQLAAGLLLGALGALAAGRLVSALLHGVDASDPLAFGGALALLALAGGVAIWWPARRATRVAPMAVLRAD